MLPERIERRLRNLLKRLGYDLVVYDPEKLDEDHDFRQEDEELGIIRRVRPYTMTSRARISALYHSVDYVVKNRIPGDIAECGVWKGGSMMAVALRLLQLGSTDRTLYLFDTFEGMTPPGKQDCDVLNQTAASMVEEQTRGGGWCYSPLADVQKAMYSTGYPPDRIVFVKGPVEETLPAQAPQTLAILRLDTDWYQSTVQELVHLYPRLSVGGVMILDDYGYWRGMRQAIDEYIASNQLRLLLNRIDVAARICVKLDPMDERNLPQEPAG